MPFVEFNLATDFVVPMALYNKIDDNPRSLLQFPILQNKKWYFPESLFGMELQFIFYVFSPSILPLPPETFMFNVEWKKEAPYGIVDLLYIFNNYDVNSLETSTVHGTVVFGAYRKPVPGTIPLYVHRRKTSDGLSSFISNQSKPPEGFDWSSRLYALNPDISPIFVMKEKPKGFSVNNAEICVPSSHTNTSINDCNKQISSYKKDISAGVSPETIVNENLSSLKSDKSSSYWLCVSVLFLVLVSVFSVLVLSNP